MHKHRWTVLVLLFITSIGHYICVQLPSSLETYFLKKEYGLNHTQTTTFFSIVFIPSIVFTVICGVLADRYGFARCCLYFYIITSIGQFIVLLGCWFKYYPLMLIGRIIYGSCSEGYQVAATSIITKYFKNAEIFVAMSLQITIGRIAASMTYWITPILMKQLTNSFNSHVSITIIMTIGFICMVIGILAAFLIFRTDNKPITNEISENMDIQIHNNNLPSDTIASSDSDIIKSQNTMDCEYESNECYNIYIFQGLNEFGLTYWILSVLIIPFNYIVTWGFSALGPKYLETRFDLDKHDSGYYIAIVSLLPAVLGPFIAYIVDLKGKRANWLLFGSIVLLFAHISFYVADANCGDNMQYFVPIMLVSIGYSITPSIVWSCFGFIVNNKFLGQAIGIAAGLLSAGMAITPIIIGKLVDLNLQSMQHKYQIAEIIWIICSIIALFSTICLILVDRKNKGGFSD
eukprot:419246_1